MFKNQLALGLKGMINKISSDNKSDNNLNNTPKNERLASFSSDSSTSESPVRGVESVHNSNQYNNQMKANNYSNDDQEVEGFLCPLCLRAFPSPESLSEHYSSEHSDFSTGNAFQCNECKMKFGSEQELGSHHTRHHSNSESTDEIIKREFSKISSVIGSEELELLRGQIIALEESKQLISNECQTLRQQLRTSEQQMIDISNELSELKCTADDSDSDILKKELVKVQKLMNDMSVEREREKELLTQEIKKQMEVAVNERQSMNKELQDLKIKHKQAIDDLMDMRSKKEKLEVELNLLRNEGITVSSLRDDIENKCAVIGKLEQSVEILTKQLENVKIELIETQRERDHFKDELLVKKQLETQCNEFKEKAEKTTKDNIELNVMVSQLKSQLESLSSQYETLNIKTKVQDEMKSLGEQLDSKLAQEVEVLKIDLMTAKQNLETSKLNNNKTSQELNQIKKLYQTLQEDNNKLIKKFNSLNEKTNLERIESENTNKNFLKQINLLEDENKLSKNELENCRIAEKQITSKYNEENAKLTEITNQLTLKEKAFDEIVKEKEKLETIIQNSNQEKELLQNNLEKIEIENESLKRKANEIEEKLSITQNEKSLLNEELSNVSKMMEISQSEHEKCLIQKNDEIVLLTKKVVDFDQKVDENNSLLIKLNELELKSNKRSEMLNLELNDKSKLIDSQIDTINKLNEKLILCGKDIELLKKEIDSLEIDKIKSEELLENNKLMLTKLNEDFNEKCAQLQRFDIEIVSIKELLKSKDLNLSNIESELENVRKELQNSNQMNETLNSSLSETQLTLENKNKENENLREELKKAEKIQIQLTMQLKSKSEEIQQKDTENASAVRLLNEDIMKLRAGIEKEKSKQENYHTLNDQLLGTKLELEAKLSNLSEEKRALIERCINSEEECDKLKNEVFQMRHKLDDSIAALHELGRENQSLQIEQTKLVNRRWADDNEAIGCAKCEKAFSVTNRKHHCRNCGQIFCNECSSKSAVLALYPKPVRVCDNCHKEMNKS